MKVKELMSTNITCVRQNTSLSQAAKQMRNENVGCLPVCDDSGHLNGLVTDRDLVIRAVAPYLASESGRDAAGMTVGDIMSLNPVTVSPDTNTHDAALLFSAHKIRRLPVVENSRLTGMLSLGDLAVKPVCIDEAGDALSAISLSDAAQAER